ncbi:PP2C family protein-serine/threonine phosphatase, partial [Streptomyces sp. NPDC001093]|uniref:PP2C family protein-serine/threonine phosphatase n=1 Tax=Streptomyces sp. NPDC001093 TaxID=3154376 RepID=UPI003317FA92
DHDTQVEMINMGHPPPLLLHDGQVTVLHARRPVPPLGMCELPAPSHRADPFTFEDGDMLLLYTDGVTEARSPKGAFYPLTERAASAPTSGPEALLRHIHRDLLEHVGHEPGDDAALLAIERYGAHHLHRPHTTARPLDGHRRLDSGSKPVPEGPS